MGFPIPYYVNRVVFFVCYVAMFYAIIQDPFAPWAQQPSSNQYYMWFAMPVDPDKRPDGQEDAESEEMASLIRRVVRVELERSAELAKQPDSFKSNKEDAQEM